MYNRRRLLGTLDFLETGPHESWEYQRMSAGDRAFVIAYSLGDYRRLLEESGVVRRYSIGRLKHEGIDLTPYFNPRFRGRPVSDEHFVYEIDFEKLKNLKEKIEQKDAALIS